MPLVRIFVEYTFTFFISGFSLKVIIFWIRPIFEICKLGLNLMKNFKLFYQELKTFPKSVTF